ncbi:MAG: hypothetical protein E6I67_08855 [Chloroflexi bacterium]|nr:MAG: hypothetical protein E6I67_08855 [Chloroflexota bacterium]
MFTFLSRIGHLAIGAAVVAAVTGVMGFSTLTTVPVAAHHNALAGVATCRVSGDMVYASGLPAGQVINFMITDSSGSHGWVLGYTSDGTWGVLVPAQNGPTTYQFISLTSGSNGSKYTVFATC